MEVLSSLAVATDKINIYTCVKQLLLLCEGQMERIQCAVATNADIGAWYPLCLCPISITELHIGCLIYRYKCYYVVTYSKN